MVINSLGGKVTTSNFIVDEIFFEVNIYLNLYIVQTNFTLQHPKLHLQIHGFPDFF